VSSPSTHAESLTHSQLQIWIGQRLNAESPLYNMAFAFVFTGEVSREHFQRAWQRVVDDSEALRTWVSEQDGVAVRRIRPVGCCPTAVVDFRSDPEPVGAFRRWARDRCARPLPLDGELVESVLVQLGDGHTGWYLNQHHLIADAWSCVLVYRQVAAWYAALSGTGEAPVELSPYYETAIRLQGRHGRAGDKTPNQAMVAASEHWRSRQPPQGRTLPLYGRHVAPANTASTRVTMTVDRARADALHALCLENGFESLSRDTSRFAVFATLVLGWLSRISASLHVGFDAPIGGRPTLAARRSIGLFIEMFPFAVAVEAGDTFRTLGRRCLDETSAFLRHALPGTSAPSSASASNVVLNFFPEAFGSFAGLPADVEWLHPGHSDRVHALRLQVHDFAASGRYTLHFDFNDSVWPERLRERVLHHFDQLLTACLADPDQTIASVDVRTDDERLALAVFNRGANAPRCHRTVVTMFDDQALATPDRVALREGTNELSFERLRVDVSALAATLAARGVAPGDRVAILSRRSVAAVVAILGTLRAGAAYVPVDPAYPAPRIESLVRDAGARIVLVGPGVSAGVIPGDLDAVPILEGINSGLALALDRPMPELGHLAYLLYTSGSTGRPKGVLIDHGGLADYLEWASRCYVRGDCLAFPLCTSLTFDLTVTSLFLPLITGGRLEIYPEPDGPVDSAVMDVASANVVDFIKLTPSHLSLLRRIDLSRSRIQRMVVGGEDLKTELAASISAPFGGRLELYNEYGPTEAVVGCIVHRYDPAQDRGASVPIGVPIDRVEVDVLSEAGIPVPDGVPGELWVSSPGLAPGYHALPDITAARFLPHPRRPNARRYRTGDLVRFNESGILEYLGRVDRQVKVSGVRIEPAEIEAALLQLPGIDACAVVVRRQPTVPSLTGDEGRACVRCGLSSSYPAVRFDSGGVCNVCLAFEAVRPRAQAYFRGMEDLRGLFAQSRSAHAPRYDCMMLLSGGKDSTYALCQLVEMGLSVYAFTFDNGFISEDAKANMRRVTGHLGVPLEFGTTPFMNAIFRDSLTRFSNVCHGCFKTIYTLGTNRAQTLGIPVIVTGLSRGQMFETRLTEEMFLDDRYSPDDVDAAVKAARRVYHRVDDEVARTLDVTIFQNDRVFEDIQFVDFYRYCDVGLDDMLSYLERTVPWVRPADTGRSTNCLINDVGIYIHRKERGYHNYALPYSWDVRLGHKTRAAALDELNDELDMDRVRRTLAAVGYDENRLSDSGDQSLLTACYVSSAGVDEAHLRRQLGDRLPAALVPAFFIRLDDIPLTPHGKVDEAALSRVEARRTPQTQVPPEGPVEAFLVATWQDVLHLDRIGAVDNFFQLGGTSLKALEVMLRLCREFDIDLPLVTVFERPTVRELARVAEQRILDDVADADGADTV